MKQYKFHNETYQANLTLLIFDAKNPKDVKSLTKRIAKFRYSGIDLDKIIDDHYATVLGTHDDGLIAFDTSWMKDTRKSRMKALEVLQHECGHIRNNFLNGISEVIEKTDSECYLRISDWCFRKCLSVPFFKKMIK